MEVSALFRDVCLRMTVMTRVLKMIRVAESSAIKEENWKNDRVVGQVSTFDYDSRGLLTLHDRI